MAKGLECHFAARLLPISRREGLALQRCAIQDGRTTVWSRPQGTFPLRGDLATVLDLPPAAVDVIHARGWGCYGHNGTDDVALDGPRLTIGAPKMHHTTQSLR